MLWWGQSRERLSRSTVRMRHGRLRGRKRKDAQRRSGRLERKGFSGDLITDER